MINRNQILHVMENIEYNRNMFYTIVENRCQVFGVGRSQNKKKNEIYLDNDKR